MTERVIPWAASAAIALPVALCRYPPMYDLPCHEEIVAAMRHFGDSTRYPPGLLTWNLGHPNQLFYFLALSVALLVPVAVACKVVVVASVAAVPLAAVRLADHLSVSRWAAAAVAPLGLGFFFFFGFVGNLLSFSLLLACLPQLDVFVRAPTLRRSGAATLTLLVLYEAHESGLLIACLAMLVFALGQPATLRHQAMRATPAAAAVGVVLTDHWRASRHLSPELRRLLPTFDLSLWQKRDGLPQALLGLHGSTTTLFPFWTVVSAIALLALHGLVQRGWPAKRKLRTCVYEYRFELLGVLLVLLYFAFPFSIQGAMWLHARFLPPGVAILAVSLTPRLPALPWVLTRAASIAGIGVVLAMLRPEFAATGALYSDLERLLPKIEPGSAVAAVDVFGAQWRHLVFSVGGAAARASAERGGRMAVSFTQASPIPPVVIAPDHRWEDSFARMSATTLGFKPTFDLHRFRYVLSWTPTGKADDLTQALSPEARLVAQSGAWLLYESTMALESILSSEPRSGAEESLKRRLEDVHAASRTSSPSDDAPTKSDPPQRVRRDSVRVPLATGRPGEDFWQMHESSPLIEPDEQPRPVTLLFHGMCADSSWTCDWLQYFEMAPQWQVCPRATAKCAGQEGYRWTTGSETRRLVEVSVATLKERHDGRVRDDGMVLAGFSLGAYAVASLVHELARNPSASWHVRGILAQGAHVHFSAADLRAMGLRVVLTAGDLDAAAPAMRAEAERLRREGVDVRYVSLGNDESHFTSVSTGKLVSQLIDWCRGE